MNIAPTFKFNYMANCPTKFTSAKNNQTQEQDNKEFKLPNYALSFGMAKIARSQNYPENTLPRNIMKKIDNFYDKYHDNDSYEPFLNEEEFGELVDLLNEQDAHVALRFLKGSSGRVNYRQMSESYLEKMVEAFCEIEDDKKRSEVLENVLTHRDVNGDNIILSTSRADNLHIPDYVDGLCEVAYKDTPQALGKCLMQKVNGDTSLDAIVKKIQYSRNNAERREVISALESKAELLNDVIYNLTTQTEDFPVGDSIELLEVNSYSMDLTNKRVLEMYESGDYETA